MSEKYDNYALIDSQNYDVDDDDDYNDDDDDDDYDSCYHLLLTGHHLL